jgi:hypothetical protein
LDIYSIFLSDKSGVQGRFPEKKQKHRVEEQRRAKGQNPTL